MWQTKIYDAEYELVRRSVEKRQREFIAGRASAREALKQLGVSDFPILHNQRSPIWPTHIVGSISHTQGFCAAIVSTKDAYLGIGMDVEQSSPLDTKLLSHILTPDETLKYSTYKNPLGLFGKIIFSIKESLFKAYHPLCQQYFGFQSANILLPYSLKKNAIEYNKVYTYSAIIDIKPYVDGWHNVIINGLFTVDKRYTYSIALIPSA